MKRIFFVEDDLSLIGGLSFALRKQGYEIDIARTSMEAESLWQNGIYDLVILDVSLPDGSGYDLCRKIRETSRVPVMFLTAADEETDIGMSKQQVVRFVRLEALNWCKTAVPIGVLLVTCLAWGLNAVLRYLVGGEFSEITVFGVSTVGIASGAVLGVLTVWIAAQSPAKRAARVSPIAAVSGNAAD